jgi:hypothetical protein
VANEREGLHEVYLVKKGEQTGACAVIITGHHRYVVVIPYILKLTTLVFFRADRW